MTTRRSKRLNLATISDIHVGNRRLNHTLLIENLDSAFPDNDKTGELDLIVFAGDIYDDLLSLNNEVVIEFDVWVAKFLRMCKRRNIAVRVLEGTRSHDWGQPSRFVAINEQLGEIGADLVYVSNLEIRYEERFDMNFLFVPDDLHHDPNVTLGQVRELLAAKNLTQVDFAFMHGNFKYQLPAHIRIPHHDEHAYLELVKFLILIGHIHTYSQFDRIYAQGSFDRISHNEEEAKGHLRISLYTDNSYEVEFIENKNAHKFITVDITGLAMEQCMERIRERARSLPDSASLRVMGEKNHPVFSHLRSLITEFPLVRWSTKENVTKEELQARQDLAKSTEYEPIYINRENVTDLLMERLTRLKLDTEDIQRAASIIADLR